MLALTALLWYNILKQEKYSITNFGDWIHAGCVSHCPILLKRGVTVMSTYEAIDIMLNFGLVLLTLLSVIVLITKSGKK